MNQEPAIRTSQRGGALTLAWMNSEHRLDYSSSLLSFTSTL